MAIVREEIKDPNGTATLMVCERAAREVQGPWRIARIVIDDYSALTPKELRALGRWITAQGRRIGREYKSNGARRTQGVNHDQ